MNYYFFKKQKFKKVVRDADFQKIEKKRVQAYEIVLDLRDFIPSADVIFSNSN